MIDISDLNKADVLAALYNAAKPQGMGFMQYDPSPMTREEAATLIKAHDYFDYLKGRVMKVYLDRDDQFDELLYDRDNGAGTAKLVIDMLRGTGKINGPIIASTHKAHTRQSAQHVMNHMQEPTEAKREADGSVHVRMGLADVAEHLKPKVKEALNEVQPDSGRRS